MVPILIIAQWKCGILMSTIGGLKTPIEKVNACVLFEQKYESV
jgi:hypothetical protein